MRQTDSISQRFYAVMHPRARASQIMTRNAWMAYKHNCLTPGASARSFDSPVVAFRRCEITANLYPLKPDRSDLYALFGGLGLLFLAALVLLGVLR